MQKDWKQGSTLPLTCDPPPPPNNIFEEKSIIYNKSG